MKKQNVVRTQNGILFSTGKGILTHETTLMKFEEIILSEISESQMNTLGPLV